MNEQPIDLTFGVGDIVPEDGVYACVPCGNKIAYKAGERFKSCLECLKNETETPVEGLELWEKIS